MSAEIRNEVNTAQVPAATLWKATAAAILVGLITLFAVILPAEYNIDPTGVGKALNLTALSPEALEAMQAAQAQGASHAEGGNKPADTRKSVQLTLMPNSGLEYKMTMQQGAQVDFRWISSRGQVYVDMHGEPKGDTSGYFKSYVVGRSTEMKGSFIAPFEGSHGWYFKNETDEPVLVQLMFQGDYENPHLL